MCVMLQGVCVCVGGGDVTGGGGGGGDVTGCVCV